MEAFFKETITGIILLGAIGSILAASIIFGLNKFIKIMTPKLYALVKTTAAKVVVFSLSPGIKSQIQFYLEASPNKLDAYYSSQKSKIVILLTISTCLFLWITVRIKIDGVEPFSLEAISYISLLFLMLGMLVRSHLSVMVPLFIDIDEEVEKHIKNLDPEMLEAYKQYRASKALQRESH